MTDHAALTWRDLLVWQLDRWYTRRIQRRLSANGERPAPRGWDCECYLPSEPPTDRDWWRPDLDDDPEPRVKAVARWGEDPLLRRAVRVGDGWVERGAMVDFYLDITPPMPWCRVGMCWNGTPHPVVECEVSPES